MTRLSLFTAQGAPSRWGRGRRFPPQTLGSCGALVASLLATGFASAQTPPAAGVPAAATAPPPPPAQPTVAGAATAIQGVTPEYVDKPDFNASRQQGWSPKVSVGATLAFANNNNVVGQVDGSSFSFGMKIDGGADYNYGSHEWRNTVGVVASVARTPVISDFVKTSDNLGLESIYLYHVVPWFGPFVRVSANTAMFRGSDVRPGTVAYRFVGADGNPDPSQAPIVASHLTLSDPFRPLTFKQSVGVFFQPYQTSPLTIELRGGLGAQEILSNNQIALVPPSPTNPNPTLTVKDPVTGLDTIVPEVDIKALTNANQLGAELAISAWGSVVDKKVTYKVNADAMLPFTHTALPPGDTRNNLQLMNIQVDATVSFKLVEWASLDYQLKALRQPQVLDAFQVQNTLLLTFALSFGGKPPAPACVPCAPPGPPAADPGAPTSPAPPPPPPPAGK